MKAVGTDISRKMGYKRRPGSFAWQPERKRGFRQREPPRQTCGSALPFHPLCRMFIIGRALKGALATERSRLGGARHGATMPSGDAGASRELLRGSHSPCLKRKMLLLRRHAGAFSTRLPMATPWWCMPPWRMQTSLCQPPMPLWRRVAQQKGTCESQHSLWAGGTRAAGPPVARPVGCHLQIEVAGQQSSVRTGRRGFLSTYKGVEKLSHAQLCAVQDQTARWVPGWAELDVPGLRCLC